MKVLPENQTQEAKPAALKIHSSAVIHPSAVLGSNISIGPFTIIGPHVRIGDNTAIGPGVLIEEGTLIGSNCQISHGASIGGPPQILNFKDIPSSVHIGDGTTLREYVTIHRSGKENGVTRVGQNCLLMSYAHVAHDCEIADNVVIVNSVGLSGHVVVEEYAFVSGITGVHQFVRIGKHAMVGGGMIVRQNILPWSLVAGPPPRLVGINAVGMRRRNFPAKIRSAIKKAFKLILQSDLNTSQAIEKMHGEIEMTDEIRYLIDFIKNSPRGITKGESSEEKEQNDESH
ncbi:MAG: acyl-[acyl-carrier-protein]--UDP-N-acetylglucosamine O-acyltransferase [Nitrospinae bacterium RIFCSPLOWO2_12_FULL_47_7]|nr:MAG: acyl-[acyl-carrier-protein]--UDP-N-acetylglucosamine O-acyltransferase [Nitrospinae bacterium RIFCSPLOWO2_12_FULL_47_7]